MEEGGRWLRQGAHNKRECPVEGSQRGTGKGSTKILYMLHAVALFVVYKRKQLHISSVIYIQSLNSSMDSVVTEDMYY